MIMQWFFTFFLLQPQHCISFPCHLLSTFWLTLYLREFDLLQSYILQFRSQLMMTLFISSDSISFSSYCSPNFIQIIISSQKSFFVPPPPAPLSVFFKSFEKSFVSLVRALTKGNVWNIFMFAQQYYCLRWEGKRWWSFPPRVLGMWCCGLFVIGKLSH